LGRKFEPIIDPEFEALIPPLSDEEFSQLEQNILDAGECYDPLITWNKVLLDGHNRWKIIQKHPDEISYECSEMIFFSRNEAMVWMIRNQLGRRNLTAFARTELSLKLKPLLAEEAEKRMKAGKADPTQKSAGGEVRDEIAKAAQVSHDTVSKVEKILDKAPEEVKDQLRRGEVSINKAFNMVRDSEKQKADTDAPKPTRKVKEYGVSDLERDITEILDWCIDQLHILIDAHQDIATDSPDTVLTAIEEFERSMAEVKERVQ